MIHDTSSGLRQRVIVRRISHRVSKTPPGQATAASAAYARWRGRLQHSSTGQRHFGPNASRILVWQGDTERMKSPFRQISSTHPQCVRGRFGNGRCRASRRKTFELTSSHLSREKLWGLALCNGGSKSHPWHQYSAFCRSKRRLGRYHHVGSRVSPARQSDRRCSP